MRDRNVRWLAFVGLDCTLSWATIKVTGQSSTPWPPDASQHKLYMIGNAHIDLGAAGISREDNALEL